ncbi:MAG TPA: acyl-CoA dehydrogenase [Casimicrobiaceae bacterium]|nr:acyl-CoA dehydrogenase [Casimicrobiaceae bacterium]
MNFDYNEEQQLLAASIRRFVEKDYGFETRRQIVTSAEGWSREVWAQLAKLGVLGLALPDEHGGFGGGATDLAAVMEAFGDALLVEPFLSTVVLGAQFVARGATLKRRGEMLPVIAEGRLTMALAHTERGARYDLARIATRARRTADGYAIDGEKRVVLHAPCANVLVVSARSDGGDADASGVSLFLVDASMPGVSMHRFRTLDGCFAADIAMRDVRVGADAVIGEESGGLVLLEEVVDFATALLCAEAVGAIAYANAATLEYLKTRRQFGVPIGSFQALQHRMVDMMIAHEQAQSMASLACATVDRERDPIARKRVVSAAKVKIADACRLVSQESVQLHGGMGMSDEMKISHTFRRLTMIAQQFGDAEHHLERFAAATDAGRS